MVDENQLNAQRAPCLIPMLPKPPALRFLLDVLLSLSMLPCLSLLLLLCFLILLLVLFDNRLPPVSVPHRSYMVVPRQNCFLGERGRCCREGPDGIYTVLSAVIVPIYKSERRVHAALRCDRS